MRNDIRCAQWLLLLYAHQDDGRNLWRYHVLLRDLVYSWICGHVLDLPVYDRLNASVLLNDAAAQERQSLAVIMTLLENNSKKRKPTGHNHRTRYNFETEQYQAKSNIMMQNSFLRSHAFLRPYPIPNNVWIHNFLHIPYTMLSASTSVLFQMRTRVSTRPLAVMNDPLYESRKPHLRQF